MHDLRLAILGAGSVRCAPPVLAALANYFGERKLEIRLYDADEERLDLFDLLARAFFTACRSTHTLRSTSDPAEALEDADRVILMIDENCARKYLKLQGREGEDPEATVAEIVGLLPDGACVVSLVSEVCGFMTLDWPGEVPEGNTMAVAHETLRIIRGEENPFPYLKQYERTPIREWLEGILV